MCDPSLKRSVEQLSSSDILVDCRAIRPGDETALLEEEARSIPARVLGVRRASGAVRVLGRELLARLGHAACAIPKGASGAPQWPAGIVGSFAHDDVLAVAAVGRQRDISAIGIDVEPAEPLPVDLRDLVVTPHERAGLAENACRGRLIFTAKEAVYKAVAALDGALLDYRDIEINLAARRAVLSDGRVINLRYCIGPQLVVLAYVPNGDAARV
jgi:4'-phosphopantetheinyl transferase EntD